MAVDTAKLLAGRYRPLRTLGSGGMARVILAEDERLGRRVAIKQLHAHGAEDTARRFEREAKLGASLNHPNVVAVYDVATDGESVLIVMEHVEGRTLKELISDGPLGSQEVLKIVRDIATALDHAHAQGVVHRDVKPANIIVRGDGTAKLADLGIATARESTRITQAGTVLGTASYMAPEQLEGGEVGAEADVYSLAAVAYEALSGRKAREGGSPVEIAHRMVSESVPDLRDAWPGAPDAAARTLRRGMATEPSERHRSAGELARELNDSLGRTAATAPTRPIALSGRAPRLPAWLPVAALLAVVAVVGLLLLSGGESGDERSEAGGGQTPAQPGASEGGAQEATPSRPEQSPAAPSRPAPGDGAALNSRGFALMNQGRHEEAIPILRQAVASYGSGTRDLNYAYALFNLGKSLRLAGRPREAIPILERRLRIPNQRGVVRKELEAARRDAG